ncbi:MAG: SLBB domain-containing protein [Actinomycetota bacterium]|nr:SLBB domain-containing protein [Actinomycetota bacterium]
MEGLSRTQLAVYAAIGVVLILLGVRALREPEGGGGTAAGDGGVQLSQAPVGSAGPGPSEGDVVVHVAGEVAEPGVYRLPVGSRVADAIERAGGAGARADPNSINLAARIADGQQVVVPRRVASDAVGATTSATGVVDGPISLGSADQAALETIEGIGPVTAADILEFRDANGGVSAIEELDEIPGIGPTTIESLSGSLQP